MHRLVIPQVLLVASFFSAAPAAFAQFSGPPPTASIVVQEIPQVGGGDELDIINQSNQTSTPFDVTFLVVISDGSSPTTTNNNWITQTLGNSSLWDLPMGSPESGQPTWHQYTSAPYPADPGDPCLGFYLNYTYDATTGEVSVPADPCRPGTELGSFFFQDPVGGGSTGLTFLVGGPADPLGVGVTSFTLGDIQTYADTVEFVPEPGSCILLMMCGAGICARPRRRIT